MKQLLIEPIGVAIHTRKEEQGSNYDWCVQAGTLQLFELADKVYATVLRGEEIGNLESAKFAIIRKNKRLGLLIANMPTTRSHFAGGAISTTLYLEFNAPEQSVLDAIATLLSPIEHSQLQLFCNYAEEIFNSKDATIIPAIQFHPVHIPDEPIVKKTGCVFSSNSSRERYASFVANLPNNFCFISAGYVKLHQYQEIKDILQCKTLLLTTGEVVTPPTCLTWLNLFFILMFTTATVVVYEYVRTELQKQAREYEEAKEQEELKKQGELKKLITDLTDRLAAAQKEKSAAESSFRENEKEITELQEELLKNQTVTEATGKTSATENAGTVAPPSPPLKSMDSKSNNNQIVTCNYYYDNGTWKLSENQSVECSETVTEATGTTSATENAETVTPPPTVVLSESIQQSGEYNDFETWLSLKAVDKDGKLTDKTIGDSLQESGESFKQWLNNNKRSSNKKSLWSKWSREYPEPAYFLEEYCSEFTDKYNSSTEDYCEKYREYRKKKLHDTRTFEGS